MTASASPGGKSLLLFVAALLPRLYVAIAWTREPVWDGHYYHIGARHIASGAGYVGTSGGAWSHYPVGYSALLGGVYKIFGSGQYVGPIMNAVAGALLALAVYRLARHATSERRALVAGALTAVYPGLIAYSALLMTEPVAALALVGAAWAAVAQRRSWRGAALAGLLLGLGALVRPQSILCAPAIALLAPWGEGARWKQRLRAGGLASALALAIVSPWSIRNCLVMDGCAFVSTNGGWNLAIGSFPRATGRFATLRGSDGCREVTGQVHQDRCWLDAGVRWIRSDPRRWIGLIPKKLSYTFDHESFPIGYLGEADPHSWPESRKSFGRGVLTAAYRGLLLIAPLGLIPWPGSAARGRRRIWSAAALALYAVTVWLAVADGHNRYWPLALVLCGAALLALPRAGRGVRGYAAVVVATVCAVHAVFFGEDRYHMVAVPFMCLLAALALDPQRRTATHPSND